MCISLDIHAKSADMDMNMDVKFHIEATLHTFPNFDEIWYTRANMPRDCGRYRLAVRTASSGNAALLFTFSSKLFFDTTPISITKKYKI